MINDLKALAIFAELIKQGSFRAAAKSLNLSPSVVSYHINQLELNIGTALIYRTTRKLSLTHDGSELLKHVKQMLLQAEQGLNSLSHRKTEPEGKLRITLTSALIQAPITQKIAQFSLMYPQIKLDISYTDEQQDLVAEGIDLAIRAGNMQDSTLIAKRIGEIQRKLVCSPVYFKQQNKLSSVEDLSTWQWIRLAMIPNIRTLTHQEETIDIHFQHQVTVNNVEALTELTIHGLGLSTPPSYLVEKAIKNKLLIEVIPQWQVKPIPLYAVWPSNIGENRLMTRLLSFLIEE